MNEHYTPHLFTQFRTCTCLNRFFGAFRKNVEAVSLECNKSDYCDWNEYWCKYTLEVCRATVKLFVGKNVPKSEGVMWTDTILFWLHKAPRDRHIPYIETALFSHSNISCRLRAWLIIAVSPNLEHLNSCVKKEL